MFYAHKRGWEQTFFTHRQGGGWWRDKHFYKRIGTKKLPVGYTFYVKGGGGVDLMMLMVKKVSKPSAEAKTFLGPYVPEILVSNNCICLYKYMKKTEIY